MNGKGQPKLSSSSSFLSDNSTIIRMFRLLLFLLLSATPVLSLTQEGLYLLQFKSTLIDLSSSLSNWNSRDPNPCNWTGIRCSQSSNPSITSINLRNVSLNGPFHSLCHLPSLNYIDLSFNYINSTLLDSDVLPCSSLAHLDLSQNLLVGTLPSALGSLPKLVYLDFAGNNFTGDIPAGFGWFPKLEVLSLTGNLLNGTLPSFLGNISSLKQLNLTQNPFSPGAIPAEIGNLTFLETLWLRQCNLVNEIPGSIGNLRRLRNIDVSMNGLEGEIPKNITELSFLFQIELYGNNLTGTIPTGLSKLSLLRNFDASMNRLVGTIPPDIFELPLLESLNLYYNQLGGEVPATITGAEKLRELRLFQNKLTGVIPRDLGKNQPLVFVDISQNQFTGEISPSICDMGLLEAFMIIKNKFTGSLPESLARCRSMLRLRLSDNFLSGEVPVGIWSLPHVYYLDLAINSFSGTISPSISGAHNLSSLVIFSNNFSGTIPEEVGFLSKLQILSAGSNSFTGSLPASLGHVRGLGILDLHGNMLSGELLTDISSWTRLTELNLANNRFTGSIPPAIGNLSVLNYLDLSNNLITGEIPSQLQSLTLNTFNFSNNYLSGPLPPLFATDGYKDRFLGNPGLCGSNPGLCHEYHNSSSNRHNIWFFWTISVLAVLILLVGVTLFYWRYLKFKKAKKEMEKSKWMLTSFHKLRFSEDEFLENLDEDNVIGTGASGKVYKVTLSSGVTVAVKKLRGSSKFADVESQTELRNDSFEAEVATLGKIRHKCIVKLWCCCSHKDCKLLVYEYMPNGSLGDLLHSSKNGLLDWPTRYRIALDAAEGLSYLHHDCSPPIVHRDIKSNNILLDLEFGAKVADFGVAKSFEVVGKGPKSMSVIAGSCGYIAPEYVYTLRVNEKIDIFSFGVVLLELVTGKHPVDPEFGEKDIVKWIYNTLEQKGVDHVLDPNLNSTFQDEIVKLLEIALQCTSSLPINRPSMRKVVKMIQEIHPSGNRSKSDKDGILSPYYEDSSDQGSLV